MNLRAMLGEVGASEGGFDFRNQKFCAVWRRGDKIFTRPATPRDLPELDSLAAAISLPQRGELSCDCGYARRSGGKGGCVPSQLR